MRKLATQNLIGWFVTVIMVVALPLGCSTEYYKEEADKEVYQIIDEKWQDDFGVKANFRISDVDPGPEDIHFDPNDLYTPTGVISLKEAVRIATAKSRQYQSSKESLYSSALSLSMSRHNYEPRLRGMFGGGYSRTGSNESVSGDGSFNISQLLADGASVSLSVASDWFRYLTGDPSESLGSVLSATVSQPLLQGAGRKIAQEGLTQSERSMIYQLRNFARFRKTFVVNIISQYYNVLQANDNVVNAQNSLKNRIDDENRERMMVEAERRTMLDFAQFEQSRLSAEDNLKQSEQNFKQTVDNFKILLGVPIEIPLELDPCELDRLRDIGIANTIFDPNDAIEVALTHRLDFLTIQDQLIDAERQVMLAQDDLRISLDLTASARANSTPETQFTRFMFHEGSYSVGFDTDLLLDRKSQRNSYRSAVISLTREKRGYEEEIDRIKLDVRDALRQLERTAVSYDIQKRSLDVASQRLESSRMLLIYNQATPRDVVDSSEDELRAQNDTTAALIDHTIAKLEFFRDIGVLQVNYDGFWYQDFFTETGEPADDRSKLENK